MGAAKMWGDEGERDLVVLHPPAVRSTVSADLALLKAARRVPVEQVWQEWISRVIAEDCAFIARTETVVQCGAVDESDAFWASQVLAYGLGETVRLNPGSV